MKRHLPIPGAAASLLLLLAGGCADIPPLISLRAALSREFPDTPIGVRLTDESFLTVTMGISLQPGSCEARVGSALRIAALVRDRYPNFPSLRLVAVEFAAPRSGEARGPAAPGFPIRFSREAIEAGLSAPDSVQALGNCTAWDELNGPMTQ